MGSSDPSRQRGISELWEAHASVPGTVGLSDPCAEPHPSNGRDLPPPSTTPVLASHSLAEVAGAAGGKGQRADIRVAGVKGGPQQHLTPLIHALGQGPGAGAGGQQGHAQPSDFTSPTWNPHLGPGEGEERKGSVGTDKPGHLQPVIFQEGDGKPPEASH